LGLIRVVVASASPGKAIAMIARGFATSRNVRAVSARAKTEIPATPDAFGAGAQEWSMASNRRSNMTPEPRSVEASLEVLRALTDKYGWEPHCKAHAAALALLRSEIDRLRGIEETVRTIRDGIAGDDADSLSRRALEIISSDYVFSRRLDRAVSALRAIAALARPDRQEEGDG